MEAKVVSKELFSVVGYQHYANLQEIDEQELGKKALTRLKENSSLIQNKFGNEIYLIQTYEQRPNFNPNVDRFNQLIGFRVEAVQNIPKDMVFFEVPASKYVTVTHRGLEADLYKTYDYLYGEWLVENPYNYGGFDFEVWDERYKPEDSGNEIDVYLALK